MKDHEDYTQANRCMWNETADVHQKNYVEDLLKRIKDPDYTTFDDVEKRVFSQIDLTGKDVAQLSCNNARELIAVKKAGAKRCLGLDISDAFIIQGRQLANVAAVEIELVCSDIYAVGDEYNHQFDLVYITVGALGWLPDLASYFALIARMLKPGGQLFMYEMHPAMVMFEPETGTTLTADYFNREAYLLESHNDYMDPTTQIKSSSYWFQHTLADILGQCIKLGLNITHFEEYRHDISGEGAFLANNPHCPPLCFSLIAKKQS